ncbi:cation transporter [Tamlana sp. 2201CG12-4]|uniref:cation transporter n=1 Tax=Tamlana sp. 2201CG12-4 TaxID=3112582 RepID=UPI002DB8EF8D|nr:cation transporter [Tamlana sp. 2201CG12-4]MEC3908124.1 cation transporter [Tamlana sp. 2201CG12-4]
MKKTLFKISRMDCPSEENLIRLKLTENTNVKHLSFDLENRELLIYHNNGLDKITYDLGTLDLGEKLIHSEDADLNLEFDNESKTQAKLLWIVLGINLAFFLIEMTTGLLSKSMGLIADSLDMLADTFVYGLSLLVVGKAAKQKKKIAKLAGYFQILLAVIGLIEVVRRFTGIEQVPNFKTMIIVSILALIANSVCLFLLQRSKSKEAHMQASMIFTSNDVIINLGVIIAGILVLWLNSNMPDLIIGIIVFALVIQGAFRILRLSK